MSKSKSCKKGRSKRVLAGPDLGHAKTAGLNSLTSASGQRTYDHDQAFESPFLLFEREVYRWILRIVHGDLGQQIVMLEAALQEPAGAAGVTLTVENGAILITPPL